MQGAGPGSRASRIIVSYHVGCETIHWTGVLFVGCFHVGRFQLGDEETRNLIALFVYLSRSNLKSTPRFSITGFFSSPSCCALVVSSSRFGETKICPVRWEAKKICKSDNINNKRVEQKIKEMARICRSKVARKLALENQLARSGLPPEMRPGPSLTNQETATRSNF